MSYHRKRWKVAPPAPESQLRQISDALGAPPFVGQILSNRGIKTAEQALAFVRGEEHGDAPFKLLGVDKAVSRIRQAIRKDELIAVYGDFDVDGITATALLTETLQALGARARPYIPNRFSEGYGLNNQALRALAAEGVSLIVTVDCGMRSPDEIAYARRLGMDLVVTDHHSTGPELPAAVAVINPKQIACSYGYQDLAGVGVAFKLAQALLKVNQRVPLRRTAELSETDLLDLVALGTVADLAPIIGENRGLVRRGLEILREMRRPGVRALLATVDLKPERIGTSAIGYILGPRLNAAGRLDDAAISYELLTCRDPDRAAALAAELECTNRERQRQTLQALTLARQEVRHDLEKEYILVASHHDFPSGIVGLVAGRLTEEFYRPAVVVEVKDDYCRGSARSIDEFNITAALDECKELLVRFGGHAAAAGFTVDTAKLSQLLQKLRCIARRQLEGQELVPSVGIDVELPLRAINWDTWQHLQLLEPFGIGNPSPLFLSRHLTVQNARVVGGEGQHLKLTLFDGEATREAIGFGMGSFLNRLSNSIDIVYALEVNDWNGEPRLQLRLEDLKPSQ